MRLQGLPASYALRAAGNFLDRMQYAKIDTVTSEALMAFVRVLSSSYMNLDTKEARTILQPYLFSDHIGHGPELKGEAEMMEQFKAVMLKFLQQKMKPSNRFDSLEPSMPYEVRVTQPSGNQLLEYGDHANVMFASAWGTVLTTCEIACHCVTVLSRYIVENMAAS